MKLLLLSLSCLHYCFSLTVKSPYVVPDVARKPSDPEWVPDSEAQTCAVCDVEFNMFKLKFRHHCRKCGQVVCGPCSRSYWTFEAEEEEGEKPVTRRVCKNCNIGTRADAGEQKAGACQICFDDAADPGFMTPCNHWVCTGCALHYLEQTVNRFTEGADAAEACKCSFDGCQESLLDFFQRSDLRKYYKDSGDEKYELFDKLDAHIIGDLPGFQKCPQCSFPWFEDEHEVDEIIKNMKCTACGYRFCGKCNKKIPDHKPRCACDEEHPKYIVMNHCRLNYCPKCGKVIEHAEQCHHMTCDPKSGGCGQHFCLDCGKALPPGNAAYRHWQGSEFGVFGPCGYTRPGQRCHNMHTLKQPCRDGQATADCYYCMSAANSGYVVPAPPQHGPDETCYYCRRGPRKPDENEYFIKGSADDDMEFKDSTDREITFNHAGGMSYQIREANNNLAEPVSFTKCTYEAVGSVLENGDMKFYFSDRANDYRRHLTFKGDHREKLLIWLRSHMKKEDLKYTTADKRAREERERQQRIAAGLEIPEIDIDDDASPSSKRNREAQQQQPVRRRQEQEDEQELMRAVERAILNEQAETERARIAERRRQRNQANRNQDDQPNLMNPAAARLNNHDQQIIDNFRDWAAQPQPRRPNPAPDRQARRRNIIERDDDGLAEYAREMAREQREKKSCWSFCCRPCRSKSPDERPGRRRRP